MTGYDFNGVVDNGRFVPAVGDVIITGNTVAMAGSVLDSLAEKGIRCPVYFSPYLNGAYNVALAAFWKAEMIQKLRLTTFHEDDGAQAQIITALCPEVEVLLTK